MTELIEEFINIWNNNFNVLSIPNIINKLKKVD